MKIITNNHWNNLLYGYELPENVKPDFDYLDDIDSESFIKYKGCYYSVNDFMAAEYGVFSDNWDGYSSDSFFSGVLIKLSDDAEQYKIATYIN